jgi:transposase
MIRIDIAWIARAPLDMRAGIDRCLAQVIAVFGSAQAHHAYLFTNRRANRLKVLVHDGFGLWLAQRRLHQGHFHALRTDAAHSELSLDALRALVLGLPWAQLSAHPGLCAY